MKKQWFTETIQLRNRCPLRQSTFHLPAAYPRIDLASLIQMDPQRFGITGRLSLAYHRCHLLLKGCTKMALTPLQAASNLALQASDARESLPQLIFVALHATNLGQLLEDLPFFFVRKTLLERSLLVTDALGSRGEPWR